MPSKNHQFVQSIIDKIRHIPQEYAAEVALNFYVAAVNLTEIDSGQAVLNWNFAWGDMTMEAPELMWGYGLVAPQGNAGYKWSKPANELLKTELTTQYLSLVDQFSVVEGVPITRFVVYNPITPGAFASFEPGDDTFYEENALWRIEDSLESLKKEAVATATANMKAKYDFLT